MIFPLLPLYMVSVLGASKTQPGLMEGAAAFVSSPIVGLVRAAQPCSAAASGLNPLALRGTGFG
ncbi:MAG: hypothetical protein KF752_03095 [Pirellulaceae bacterium]|nr:hypothetical protein [Pirellulaceae bacterium]